MDNTKYNLSDYEIHQILDFIEDVHGNLRKYKNSIQFRTMSKIKESHPFIYDFITNEEDKFRRILLDTYSIATSRKEGFVETMNGLYGGNVKYYEGQIYFYDRNYFTNAIYNAINIYANNKTTLDNFFANNYDNYEPFLNLVDADEEEHIS